MFLTPLLHNLRRATLAATIIIAVLSLVDFKILGRTLRYSKSDFAAMMTTILGVFFFGVEAGVMAGVILSILLLLHRASRPHSAVVGQVPGTEHFRNVRRHNVIVSPLVSSLRIDGDLFFANAAIPRRPSDGDRGGIAGRAPCRPHVFGDQLDRRERA